ncbi:MAG: DUF3541 domain-containing protein [Tatlockia sp.]|nr:DUF3541 domain-containing protein [Tatlockia sp.]
MFRFLKCILIFMLCLFGQFLLAETSTIGDKIQKNFDENLYKLKPIYQSHYAVRLYRITGKKEYFYPIISFQFIESLQLKFLLKKTHITPIEKFNSRLIHLPQNYDQIVKNIKRELLLAQFPGINNALQILLILDHAQQLNLLKSPLYPHADKAIDYISKNIKPLSTFLLDPTVIKTSSAQVVNFIYLLNRLQIIDLRQEYIKHFKIIFSDKEDKLLHDRDFEDKIYGMTHIIFAASDYYQKQLPYEEFKWIYLYFDKNVNRILKKTKPDVIAEVGLNFCLLNKAKHSAALNKIRNFLKKQFDPAQQMLPGEPGLDDLNRAEHRNVLTIMLFKWPSLLHSGPNLENIEDLLNTLEPIQPL